MNSHLRLSRLVLPSLLLLLALVPGLRADDGYGPTGAQHAPSAYKSPSDLVPGGAFIDHILPMPATHPLRRDTWGGPNVLPRLVENGIEDPQWSYWCMSVRHEKDGRYHLFASRWPEGDPRGHNAWPNSEVVHTVADSPLGPFRVVQEIGRGHNVMRYLAKDGTNVLYIINGAYRGPTLDGPWTKFDLQYDARGTKPVPMSNHTFSPREDGSVLMVSRGGHVWISEDGLKPFRKITTESFFPKIPGAFEDPVVWRDEVQYHCVFNDWHGRTAFHVRSGNGVDWVWDQGKAYDIEIVRHPDGSKENWHKFERPNVLQDEFGRATHIYFAVMDAPKNLDHGKDNHSSKILALPLRVERRLSILDERAFGPDSKEVRVLVRAEPGFDPAKDLDLGSLRFGAPEAVNRGRGGTALRSEASGQDLVVTFAASDDGFTPQENAARLLGKSKSGDLVHGYARLPGRATPPLVSPLPPVLEGTDKLAFTMENFDLNASPATEVEVELKPGGGETRTLKTSAPAIPAYGSARLEVTVERSWLGAAKSCPVTIRPGCPALAARYELALPDPPAPR